TGDSTMEHRIDLLVPMHKLSVEAKYGLCGRWHLIMEGDGGLWKAKHIFWANGLLINRKEIMHVFVSNYRFVPLIVEGIVNRQRGTLDKHFLLQLKSIAVMRKRFRYITNIIGSLLNTNRKGLDWI